MLILSHSDVHHGDQFINPFVNELVLGLQQAVQLPLACSHELVDQVVSELEDELVDLGSFLAALLGEGVLGLELQGRRDLPSVSGSVQLVDSQPGMGDVRAQVLVIEAGTSGEAF